MIETKVTPPQILHDEPRIAVFSAISLVSSNYFLPEVKTKGAPVFDEVVFQYADLNATKGKRDCAEISDQTDILSFLLPLVIVCYCAYSDARNSSNASHKDPYMRFFDFLVYIIVKSDLGAIGFSMARMIHVELDGLLFVMILCADHINDIASSLD